MTDRELIERFVGEKDAGAFEEIVRVHGGMVFGVCRRILSRHQDAEDVFQATFLVLACQAERVAQRDSLASWLYGVAQRTALNVRRELAKRARHERRAMQRQGSAAVEESPWSDISSVLDEEISRLPVKYRTAIVLCDLEQKSHKEAAMDLGCPEGTLSNWVVRARGMLHKRLVGRGLVLSTATLTGVLSESAASAGVPAALSVSVAKIAVVSVANPAMAGAIPSGVVTITEGALKTMAYSTAYSTVKQVAIVVGCLAMGGFGVGGVYYKMQGAEPAKSDVKGGVSGGGGASVKGEAVAAGLKDLQGTWRVMRLEQFSQAESEKSIEASAAKLEITGTSYKFVAQEGPRVAITEGRMTLDASKRPGWLDLKGASTNRKGQPVTSLLGIYKLEGETLTFCAAPHLEGKDLAGGEVERPKEFKTDPAPKKDGVGVLSLDGGPVRHPKVPTAILFMFKRERS